MACKSKSIFSRIFFVLVSSVSLLFACNNGPDGKCDRSCGAAAVVTSPDVSPSLKPSTSPVVDAAELVELRKAVVGTQADVAEMKQMFRTALGLMMQRGGARHSIADASSVETGRGSEGSSDGEGGGDFPTARGRVSEVVGADKFQSPLLVAATVSRGVDSPESLDLGDVGGEDYAPSPFRARSKKGSAVHFNKDLFLKLARKELDSWHIYKGAGVFFFVGSLGGAIHKVELPDGRRGGSEVKLDVQLVGCPDPARTDVVSASWDAVNCVDGQRIQLLARVFDYLGERLVVLEHGSPRLLKMNYKPGLQTQFFPHVQCLFKDFAKSLVLKGASASPQVIEIEISLDVAKNLVGSSLFTTIFRQFLLTILPRFEAENLRPEEIEAILKAGAEDETMDAVWGEFKKNPLVQIWRTLFFKVFVEKSLPYESLTIIPCDRLRSAWEATTGTGAYEARAAAFTEAVREMLTGK